MRWCWRAHTFYHRVCVWLTDNPYLIVRKNKQRGAMVSILDVENVGIMDLRGDALEFLKAASKVTN